MWRLCLITTCFTIGLVSYLHFFYRCCLWLKLIDNRSVEGSSSFLSFFYQIGFFSLLVFLSPPSTSFSPQRPSPPLPSLPSPQPARRQQPQGLRLQLSHGQLHGDCGTAPDSQTFCGLKFLFLSYFFFSSTVNTWFSELRKPADRDNLWRNRCGVNYNRDSM